MKHVIILGSDEYVWIITILYGLSLEQMQVLTQLVVFLHSCSSSLSSDIEMFDHILSSLIENSIFKTLYWSRGGLWPLFSKLTYAKPWRCWLFQRSAAQSLLHHLHDGALQLMRSCRHFISLKPRLSSVFYLVAVVCKVSSKKWMNLRLFLLFVFSWTW